MFIMGRRQSSGESTSVVGHITVYKYGKLFSPAMPHKCKRTTRDPRLTRGSTAFDRPELISKIHHLLEVHRAQREDNIRKRTRCSISVHNAILKVIRLCYEQKICESKLYPVGDLFLELFLCTGNSCAIFGILLDGHMTMTSQLMNTDVNILYPNHVHNFTESKTAFEYYLHHICCIRRMDGKNKLDYVNLDIDQNSGLMPLTAAVQKRDPALVLTLLRFGADPFLPSADASFDERTQNPTEQVIDDLNGLFLFKNTNFSVETRAKLAAEEDKMWEILSYFRRAVPGIPLTSTNHIVTMLSEDEPDCVEYVDDRFLAKQMYGIHPRIAETIDIDFFKPTVSLKHLCRCAIRDQLKSGQFVVTSIPRGITMLPLPTKLKSYLDLQED